MFLGTLSYSLYIWQELFTANQVIYRSASNVRTLAVNLAMLAVVAFASWRLVEQPFIRLKDRYWK
jgi:peptidoglycan/LPS O-acetylase OafA/YrhL